MLDCIEAATSVNGISGYGLGQLGVSWAPELYDYAPATEPSHEIVTQLFDCKNFILKEASRRLRGAVRSQVLGTGWRHFSSGNALEP
jgi:hypothetical protein